MARKKAFFYNFLQLHQSSLTDTMAGNYDVSVEQSGKKYEKRATGSPHAANNGTHLLCTSITSDDEYAFSVLQKLHVNLISS